jgi:cell division protein FtsQ
MERNLRKTLLFILLPVLLLLLLLFFILWFRVETVTVTGAEYYTEEEIKKLVFTSALDYNSLYLSLHYKGGELDDIPFIQKIVVTRQSHNTVKIQVYEKTLAGCVKYMNQYIYFDKDGIVLECSDEQLEGVPLITGMDYGGFTLYQRLEVEKEEIFNKILDLSQLVQKYELSLDRIHFFEDTSVMLETSGIKIYLGEQEFYDEEIASLAEILPTAIGEGLKGNIHMESYTPGDDVIFHKE